MFYKVLLKLKIQILFDPVNNWNPDRSESAEKARNVTIVIVFVTNEVEFAITAIVNLYNQLDPSISDCKVWFKFRFQSFYSGNYKV